MSIFLSHAHATAVVMVTPADTIHTPLSCSLASQCESFFASHSPASLSSSACSSMLLRNVSGKLSTGILPSRGLCLGCKRSVKRTDVLLTQHRLDVGGFRGRIAGHTGMRKCLKSALWLVDAPPMDTSME
eukprot:364277-Chlamydomonas_euryale.AAC.16